MKGYMIQTALTHVTFYFLMLQTSPTHIILQCYKQHQRYKQASTHNMLHVQSQIWYRDDIQHVDLFKPTKIFSHYF